MNLIEARYHVRFMTRHMREGFVVCFISLDISEFLCR